MKTAKKTKRINIHKRIERNQLKSGMGLQTPNAPEKLKDAKYFEKTVYTLKSKAIPKIQNNVVRSDGAGGVKLIYNTKSFKARRCNMFDTDFYIRASFKLLSKGLKIYFRPLKESWNKDRNSLSKNDWGKPNNPLTNLWLMLDHDHHDITRRRPLMKSKVTNHAFIKKLGDAKNEFFIISNLNKSKQNEHRKN